MRTQDAIPPLPTPALGGGSEPEPRSGRHFALRWIRRWLRRILALPRSTIALQAFALFVVGAWADVASGLQLSVFAFYFVPIFMAAFLVAPRFGVLMALSAACFRGSAAVLMVHRDGGDYVVPAWNFAVDLVSFLIFTFLLASVREQLDNENALARHDPLTKVYNRRAFTDLCRQELARQKRLGGALTLVYLDLDNFKTVNDVHGHEMGDRCLTLVAEVVRQQLRNFDVVARMGGDEFAMFLPGANQESATAVLCRMQKALCEAMSERAWPVTFSVGAATFVAPPASYEDALALADGLLYRAKSQGKNQFVQGGWPERSLAPENLFQTAPPETPPAVAVSAEDAPPTEVVAAP